MTLPESKQSGQQAKAQRVANASVSKFAVFKQADGAYRWAILSSSSFEDRDGEIVSQKAQEQDVAHMDATGEYGVLDWWHTGIPLGDCDFAAMHDKVRVESGTFRNPRVGQAVAAKASDLAVSLAFFHPKTEPRNAVYENIATFARSLLPRGKESNLLTAVYVQQGETHMLKEKFEALKALLGGNDELAQSVLAQAEQAQKAAEGQGLAHKEAAAPDAKEEMPMEGGTPADPTPEEPSAEPVAETPAPDMAAMIGQAVASAIEPLVKQVGSMSASMAEMSAKLAGYEATSAEQGKAAKKEADAQKAELVAAQKATSEAIKTLDKRLKELEGDTPKAFKDRRASQAKETATNQLAVGPTPDVGILKMIDEKILGGLPGAPS